MAKHGSESPCLHDDPYLFTYTSGRYLFNEKRRLSERSVKFNVQALKEIASRSLERGAVASFRKLAEGGFNRVFLLKFEDGFEIIAKIPYSISVPERLATASEVATMDFLRSEGLPVPQVYAWSADSNNPVGVEYIIMQKAPGEPLEDRWFHLTQKERAHLMESYIRLEKKLLDLRFDAYGSICYKEALPPELQLDLHAPVSSELKDDTARFCIGPTQTTCFGLDGVVSLTSIEAHVSTSNSPSFQLANAHGLLGASSSDYLGCIGERELTYTRSFGQPQVLEFPHNTLIKGQISPNIYVDLLKKYMSISPHLMPASHSVSNRSTLRHPGIPLKVSIPTPALRFTDKNADLNPTNVFISESSEISCLIDWQHTTVLPFCLAAGAPPMFENPDPQPPTDFRRPSLPTNYSSLPQNEKSLADELYRRRMLFWMYIVCTGHYNPDHLAALRVPMLHLRQELVDRAGRTWAGNYITLKGLLIRAIEHWDQLALNKGDCPIQVSETEKEEFSQLEDAWIKMNILVEHWRSQLFHVSQDGWVSKEVFEDAVERNRELRNMWLGMGEDDEDRECVEKGWPFQDREEVV